MSDSFVLPSAESRVEVPLSRRPRREGSGAVTTVTVSPLEEEGPTIELPSLLLDEDAKVEHACGIYGVFSTRENASRVVFFALYALNHRGQESAGIASYGLSGVHVHKGMGLVSQVFDEVDIAALTGGHAIGHTRYSTSGGSKLTGAQPFVLETDLGQLAIAHNGQVRDPHLPLPLHSHSHSHLHSHIRTQFLNSPLPSPRWHAPRHCARSSSRGVLDSFPTLTLK